MDNNTNKPTDPNLPNTPIDLSTVPSSPPSDTTFPPLTPPVAPPPPPVQPEPTPIQSEPTPTFEPTPTPPPLDTTPPNPSSWPSTPQPSQAPEPPPEPEPIAPTPLDNPWGAPLQPPPINAEPQPVEPAAPEPAAPEPAETAPTDLSHLISNEPQPTVTTPEILVAPPTNGTPEVPTFPTEGNHKIPKWMIGLGVGLLILVVGASAYFILGIGQPPKTSSIPATQAPKQEIKPPPPVAQPTPAATKGSTSFGELEGSKQATSAADLLRQRQQGR